MFYIYVIAPFVELLNCSQLVVFFSVMFPVLSLLLAFPIRVKPFVS